MPRRGSRLTHATATTFLSRILIHLLQDVAVDAERDADIRVPEALLDNLGCSPARSAMLAPSLEGAAESSHLGDWAMREAGDHLLREPPAGGWRWRAALIVTPRDAKV
jgi:hypothetical protein